MSIRCAASRTSISTSMSKNCMVRLVILRSEMLPSFLAITVVAETAGLVQYCYLHAAHMHRTVGFTIANVPETSIQRSGVWRTLPASRSRWCELFPLPVVTTPTIRSPGSGWQQPAKCSAIPGIRPRIGIPDPSPVASCAGRGRAARPSRRSFFRMPGSTASTTARALKLPAPTCAQRSSILACFFSTPSSALSEHS